MEKKLSICKNLKVMDAVDILNNGGDWGKQLIFHSILLTRV